jgi:hypothetical protein
MSYNIYNPIEIIKKDNNIPVSSIFCWSHIIQPNINTTYFQYIVFEQPLVCPLESGWTTAISPGYTYPTIFIVPNSGYYLLTYKLDICSNTITNTQSAAVLTLNGIQINGSTTLVEAFETTHTCTITNTILVKLNTDDNVSLLFWSSYIGTQIGSSSTSLTGLLPNNTTPNQATATLTITKISN